MQYLKPKIAQPSAQQNERKAEKKSGINKIICPDPCSPIWQKAFALAENVRFTRTPNSEIMRRRAAIDPVYAKILAAATAAALPVPAADEAEAAGERAEASGKPAETLPPAGKDGAVVNQGYAAIEHMQDQAEAAFARADSAAVAAAILSFSLPEALATEPAAETAGPAPVSAAAIPVNVEKQQEAAPAAAAITAQADDFVAPVAAEAAAEPKPDAPAVARPADVTSLFTSLECRQPQMRWIPVPADRVASLISVSQPAEMPPEPPAPATPADKGKTDAAPGIPAASPPAGANDAAAGAWHNPLSYRLGVTYAAAPLPYPALKVQIKLDGDNKRNDAAQEAVAAAAPFLPGKPARSGGENNLDSLCSLAVEQTAKNAAAPAPAAKADNMAAAAPKPAPAAPALVTESAAMPGKGAARLKMQARYSYLLPSLELLQEPVYHEENIISQETLERSAGLLENVLEDFGVRGEIIHVRPGPVVTLYEFEPAPGVKSSRVIGLSDDIARSMSAVAARVAVIPGRNVIGIELPNKKRETVYLREILQSAAYKTSDYKLPLALGKNIGGEPIIAELAKMPHLLVAGTTGSGKSVAINTMILSLIYRMSPQECRLIMVDPKMLELSVYDGIPHLLTPVVTDPKKALSALKWAVREMEDRYRKMAKLGVRNIDGFNSRIKEALHKNETIMCTVQTGFDKETGELLYAEEAIELKPLPYIVVIIDEMADLMMVAGKEIEGAVQRLAQMARAAGIHVIMATQRPSVDVITGTIKANFPTRISFQVTSKIDSRTILGEQGAETLLGQGDMLHMAGGGRLKRVHGPFVSDREVEKVVAHLKTQGTPEYLSTVTESNDDETPDGKNKADNNDDYSAVAEIVAAAGSNEDFDDLYIQAVKIVMRDKKCSTSYIQRRLSIGYNKAASLVEKMEEEGLVGEANHVGKREILVNG